MRLDSRAGVSVVAGAEPDNDILSGSGSSWINDFGVHCEASAPGAP